MKKILLSLSLLILIGCGYKPSAHYIKNVFEDSVFVDVKVSTEEPENAVYVKDALHRMIITRFKGKVVPRDQADSILEASYDGTYFVPISYDSNGYITRYRANVRMVFKFKTKAKSSAKAKSFKRSISAYVEEDIHASSSLSSALRILAIRRGMEKALDQFLAYVATQGVIEESKDSN
ncbi:Probable lipoprotein Cj1090c [hydrothermal vent metagenome]|uniref:Probable lipoprotein Cj1090c n=1 Tax=hydrothermal vent metagenome TaxID=652676 RepID=A0A1W1CFN3_9ZZZZ